MEGDVGVARLRLDRLRDVVLLQDCRERVGVFIMDRAVGLVFEDVDDLPPPAKKRNYTLHSQPFPQTTMLATENPPILPTLPIREN